MKQGRIYQLTEAHSLSREGRALLMGFAIIGVTIALLAALVGAEFGVLRW